MLVGWGGNNGSTLTAGVIANREGISWATKEKVQQANYFGPFMEHMVPLQGSRANHVIKGTKKQQLEQVTKDIREFKEKNKVDKVIVLWTANTEKYSNVVVGLNDTTENLMSSLDKNEAEISPSTLYARELYYVHACVKEHIHIL